jgi:hypothetical protein
VDVVIEVNRSSAPTRIHLVGNKQDCEACALKPQCCPNVTARKIARSVHEGARDQARAIAKTEAYAVSCRERKKVEMLFAHLSASSGSVDCASVARAAPKTSSYWPPPPKILRKLAKLIPLPEPAFAL